MSTTPVLSSKEWKASAQKKAAEAQAQAAARARYQKQLEELQARMREAEEIERQNSEQAAIERQAARDKEFEEISLVKQADFRNTIADEVCTRVAQHLKAGEDHKYILAIVENRPGFEDPSELKAMLWEAVAGNDAAYLRQIAQKILERIGVPISEDSVNAVKDSVSCLDRAAFTPAHLQKQVSPDRTQGPATETSISIEQDIATVPSIDLPVRPIESVPGDQAQEPVSNQSTTVNEGNLEQGQQSVKQEGAILEKRNAMDEIEIPSSPMNARSRSVTPNDIIVELQDPLGNVITSEELVSRTPCQQVESHGFGSAGRKRPLTEEGTPTPSDAGSTVTPKKRKTTGTKTNAKTPSTKFKEYMEERGFTESDLLCSACNDDAQNPRVSSKCYHVYCNTCVNELKKGFRGKDAHAVKCCHVGCDSSLGAMSIVKAETITELKEALVEVDTVQDLEGEHVGVSSDDETTVEE